MFSILLTKDGYKYDKPETYVLKNTFETKEDAEKFVKEYKDTIIDDLEYNDIEYIIDDDNNININEDDEIYMFKILPVMQAQFN